VPGIKKIQPPGENKIGGGNKTATARGTKPEEEKKDLASSRAGNFSAMAGKKVPGKGE